MRRLILSALLALTAATALLPLVASADDPHVGNSGNFSTATCPSPSNPHCPPQGK